MSTHEAEEEDFPGLQAVAEAVASERALELQTFESLDSKAGVILGSAAALVALASDGWTPAVLLAAPFAIVAAVLAFVAFAPRTVGNLSTDYITQSYVGRPSREVREVLLSAQNEWCVQLRTINKAKAKQVEWAMRSLAVSFAVFLVAILREPVLEGCRAVLH